MSSPGATNILWVHSSTLFSPSSLNSLSTEIMVTGLTEMFRLKREIISIVEHETCSFVDQCVTTTVRIIVEYLYYFAILILYSVFV